MQITQPYREYTARTQFHPSRMRGFYLDLREKLYMGSFKGHIKLPDSLAPIYQARIERARKLHTLRRTLILFILGAILSATVLSCRSEAPTKPFVPCAVGYIRGGQDGSQCVPGTP